MLRLTKPTTRRTNCGYRTVLFALIAFILQANIAVAQDSEPPAWNFIKEIQNVKFYYAKAQCGSQPFLFLKVENMNSSAAYGTWVINVTLNGVTSTYSGVLVDMTPMAVRSGSCTHPDPFLAIPQPADVSDLAITMEVEIKIP